MDKPKITWFVEDEENQFMASNFYTEKDSFTPGNYLIKNFQIWNNYNGNIDIEDFNNANLVISFKNYEDNFLLNLIKVSVNDEDFKRPKIYIDRGYVYLGNLTGSSNSGQNNSGNYKNVKIKIGPIPDNISTDFKTLVFYLDNTFDVLSYEDDYYDLDNTFNMYNNLSINDVDKENLLLNDKRILKESIKYIDDKLNILSESKLKSTNSNLDNLEKISNALNNNPNFAAEVINSVKNLEDKLNRLIILTSGFDKLDETTTQEGGNIKQYIDSRIPYKLGNLSKEETERIINSIKDTLNIDNNDKV